MSTIKVAIRLRPATRKEKENGKDVVLAEEETILVKNDNFLENGVLGRIRARRYSFDYCFGPSSSQSEVFSCLSPTILDGLSNGHNGSVIAYGQTGSGKTYTMLGDATNPGLIPFVCKACLNLESISEYRCEVSFYEIYNDKVRDLLSGKCSNSSGKLRVREHPILGPYVEGLGWHVLNSSDCVSRILNVGCAARSSGPTSAHHASSRSHAIFTLRISHSDETRTAAATRLNFVDLAGSERLHYGATKEQVRESAYINKSLATLGSVILALSARKEKFLHRHIPYRNSVLTWLLKDSIGGSSTTLMIGTVSPSIDCRSETLNTLRYANKARLIISRLKTISQDSFLCGKHDDYISELKFEIARLRAIIDKNEPLDLSKTNSMDKSVCSDSSNIKNNHTTKSKLRAF